MKKNEYYKQHVLKYIENLNMSWLTNKSLLITGVTGMIGSALADMLLLANQKYNLHLRIIGIGRSKNKADKLLDFEWYKHSDFTFIEQDIMQPPKENILGVDYIVHAASNAYPAAFKCYPVETMLANIIGTKNLLDLAIKENGKLLFVSSGEVYGECDCDVKCEDDYGYVNSMDLRSCYPNSKRAAETLCVSYGEEYAVDTVVVRLSHVYGPSFTDEDNRVVSDFIRLSKNGKNLILKSTGETIRSYTYVLDACNGILVALEKGKNGEAYNVADENKAISIVDMAKIIAELGKVKLNFELVDNKYVGQTSISKQIMCGKKLKKLGWNCSYQIKDGLIESFKCLDVN